MNKSNKTWSKTDLAMLSTLKIKGYDNAFIGGILERSEVAIQVRLSKIKHSGKDSDVIRPAKKRTYQARNELPVNTQTKKLDGVASSMKSLYGLLLSFAGGVTGAVLYSYFF